MHFNFYLHLIRKKKLINLILKNQKLKNKQKNNKKWKNSLKIKYLILNLENKLFNLIEISNKSKKK